MDNQLLGWIQNITVNAVFYLIERPRRTAAVLGAWFAVRWLRRIFAREQLVSQPTPQPSTVALSTGAFGNPIVTANLTTAGPPVVTPVAAYSDWHRDSETYAAVHNVLRFERNKTAAQLAAAGNRGSAISTAVLAGLVAGEVHELAAVPDRDRSIHAQADVVHGPGPHLDYRFQQPELVTVAPAGLRMVASLGQVEVLNHPPSAVFSRTPILALGTAAAAKPEEKAV